MRRLIDVDEVKKRFPIMENDFGMVVNERLHKELDKIPTVEAIPKADYEARLKADMVDILLDVQNEIKQKELEAWGYPNIEYSKGLKLTVDIIQKKIRALKENKDAI